MITRLSAIVALLVLALGSAAGQDAAGPPGNPPALLIASGIDADGNLVLVEYETIVIQPAPAVGAPGGQRINRLLHKVPLKGVKICDKDCKDIAIETARKRLAGKDTAILALSWQQQLDPVYRRLFQDDVLVFVFPKDSPRSRPKS